MVLPTGGDSIYDFMPALTQDSRKTKGRIVGAGFRPYENEDFLGLHFFTSSGNIVTLQKAMRALLGRE
jgi:hypothetical protein